MISTTSMRIKYIVLGMMLGLLTGMSNVFAADYHVGPQQTLKSLNSVNWSSLSAGDTVYIHYDTYREKFNLSSRGTAENPIRIIGVPDSNGNRPVIDAQNAVTTSTSDFRWQDVGVIQWLGVISITVGPGESPSLPGHIEIKNLEIRNGYVDSSFTAEDGSTSNYNGFAAGIYMRSAQNVLIENCVIHGNGQGVYAWTGGGDNWWDGLSKNITIRGNHFYNNGHIDSWTEHQAYIEAENTVYEYNYFGAQRPGAWGSTIKDRGAGTVIRYNYFDAAPNGWWIDLPEPENGWLGLGFSNDAYSQAFIYGNVFVNDGNYSANYFHWNEDHQAQGNNGTPGPNGRATMENGRLYFYNNTVVTVGNRSDYGYWASFHLFNTTWGGYDCATEGTRPGIIDVRNNIFAVIPRTAGSEVPTQQFAYCSDQNFNFGKNLVTAGWISNTSGTVTGTDNLITMPVGGDFGFADVANRDFSLVEGSPSIGAASALAQAVTSNFVGADLTPLLQYVKHQSAVDRVTSGAGSDIGAYGFTNAVSISLPKPPATIRASVQ